MWTGGSSPSIAAPIASDVEVAFEANTGHLFIYRVSDNSHVDVSLGMAPFTSPLPAMSAGAQRGTSFMIGCYRLYRRIVASTERARHE